MPRGRQNRSYADCNDCIATQIIPLCTVISHESCDITHNFVCFTVIPLYTVNYIMIHMTLKMSGLTDFHLLKTVIHCVWYTIWVSNESSWKLALLSSGDTIESMAHLHLINDHNDSSCGTKWWRTTDVSQLTVTLAVSTVWWAIMDGCSPHGIIHWWLLATWHS